MIGNAHISVTSHELKVNFHTFCNVMCNTSCNRIMRAIHPLVIGKLTEHLRQSPYITDETSFSKISDYLVSVEVYS